MHPLSESLSRDGEFWLAESPDHSCFGHLSFDPVEGIYIKLLGSLRPFPESFNNSEVPNGLVHGRLENGKPVSLFGCFRTSHKLTFGNGFPRETYRVNLAAIGVLARSLEDKRFDSATFKAEGLEAWLEADWYPKGVISGDGLVFSVQTQPPQKDIIFRGRQNTITVHRFNTINNERRERVSISATADLKIESSGLQSIDWYMRQSSALTSFLSFCLAQLAETRSISVGYHDENDEGRFHEVEVVYARIDHGKVNADREALAPFSQLEDIRGLTTRWMRLYSKSKSAVRLVQEVQSDQVKYVNLRFLLAAQAAEAFHRQIFEPNQKTLRFRIDALVARLRDVLGYSPKGLNISFRERVVRTRNYYTHFSSVSNGRIFSSAEMYWASQRIAAAIIIISLHEIGISAEIIKNQLAKRDDVLRILRRPGLPY